MLNILKAYIERRELTSKIEDILDELLTGEKEKQLLVDFIKAS